MMNNFCCDQFWNLNETWNTHVPDFSSCFQDIVLVLAPCTIFSIIGLFNLFNLSRYHSSLVPLPWTWRIIFRLLLTIVLFFISVSWCSWYVYKKLEDVPEYIPSSTIAASVARSITYVIVIAQMLKHRSHGISTSSVLSVFWFCFACCGIVMHRSIILRNDNKAISPSWNYILSMLYYPIIYVELFMSFFADTKIYTSIGKGHPMDEAPFISGVLYLWFNRYVYMGWKRLLTAKDFLPLPAKIQAPYVYQMFSKYWKYNALDPDLEKKSLVAALFKAYWPWFISGFILDIIYVMCLLVPPLILDQILEFVKDDTYTWRIYYYCAVIFITTFLNKTLQNNFVTYLLSTASQVKSALISAVYRKNLLLASSERKNFTSGNISNLISVDVSRISFFAFYGSSMISSPFRIILIIIFMWEYLGVASFAGVAVMAVLIPISFYISRVSEKFSEKQMVFKDTRLKCINEIINGIKILKFYTWEVPFSEKISKTRKEEIKLIRLSQLCYVITSFVFSCAPILVSLASFTTFLFIDSHNVLTPTIAFVSLNLMEQLRFVLFTIPDSLSELVQTIIAVRRIRKFLNAEEMDPAITGNCPDEGDAVSIRNATFFWSKDSNFTLENISLKVPTGKLVAVIGPVGSGKSSMLSAILSDMYKSSGSIDVQGEFAYVPQEAWILNRTLKHNILLEKTMQEDKYNNILDCCCLRPDLEILPSKDETEIGEKGINLSGGQKQRVSVARALFQNKDIYLLDDPLSAVDAHVRKSLFTDVIGNQGLLKNKTRILVTHDISVLSDVDFIVRMEEGKILETGTYKELLDSSESFLNFIKTHSTVDENSSGDSSQVLNEDDKSVVTCERTISQVSESKQSDIAAGGNLIEDERMEIGKVKRAIYLNYIKHIGFVMFPLSMFGFISYTAIEAAGNVWVSIWTADAPQNHTQNVSETIYRLSVYGGLGFAQAVTIFLATSALVYGSTKASSAYHKEMLSSLLKCPMSFFDTTPMGRIVNRFSSDMDTLDVHIIYDVDGFISCVLYCLASFIVIGINTPLFFASLVPLSFIYYIVLRLHLNTSRQIRRLESVTKSPMYSHLLESVYGVISIRSFKVEKEFIEKMEEYVDNHVTCYLATIMCNRWLHFWMDLISAIVILIATWLAIHNRESLGESVVGLVVNYALVVTDSLMWVVRCNNELENKSVSIERVDEYCHLPPEAPWQQPNCDPDASWPEEGEIVFDNYSTRYRENLDLVLKKVNLSVTSNEKVGIIGRTGAGKSSVTLSLFRIIEPAAGTIYIDNTDVSKIGLHSLRSKLTIIPQDPVLFTGSLRFNLDPNDEYDDSEIWGSLSNAHLKDYVSTLAEGLQHNVEEGGKNLSAGQKQLLCLARALLKKSKILILDEATAAVDMDTDKLVQDTIKTAFANHTVITIAHRLNTVMDYNKIIVMDAGEVAEVGSPSDLLQNKESCFYQFAKEAKLV